MNYYEYSEYDNAAEELAHEMYMDAYFMYREEWEAQEEMERLFGVDWEAKASADNRPLSYWEVTPNHDCPEG